MRNTNTLALGKIQTFGMSDLYCHGVGTIRGNIDILKIMSESLCILELHFTIESGDLEKVAIWGVQAVVAPFESQAPLALHSIYPFTSENCSKSFLSSW